MPAGNAMQSFHRSFFPLSSFYYPCTLNCINRVGIWSNCIMDRVLLFFAFFPVCNQRIHYSNCCAELFMSHVGIMTIEHITGMYEPELGGLETIVLFWLPESSRSLETSLAAPCFREWFRFWTVTTDELICSLKRKNSPEVHFYILKNSMSFCVSMLFCFLC